MGEAWQLNMIGKISQLSFCGILVSKYKQNRYHLQDILKALFRGNTKMSAIAILRQYFSFWKQFVSKNVQNSNEKIEKKNTKKRLLETWFGKHLKKYKQNEQKKIKKSNNWTESDPEKQKSFFNYPTQIRFNTHHFLASLFWYALWFLERQLAWI